MIGRDDDKGPKTEERNQTSKERPLLNRSVADALKNLEGKHGVYEEETVKKVTSLCMRYLQDQIEVPRRDLKMSIYFKFLDASNENTIREILKKNENLTERDMWEISKSALELIEKKTDMVEITKDEDAHIYRWKK